MSGARGYSPFLANSHFEYPSRQAPSACAWSSTLRSPTPALAREGGAMTDAELDCHSRRRFSCRTHRAPMNDARRDEVRCFSHEIFSLSRNSKSQFQRSNARVRKRPSTRDCCVSVSVEMFVAVDSLFFQVASGTERASPGATRVLHSRPRLRPGDNRAFRKSRQIALARCCGARRKPERVREVTCECFSPGGTFPGSPCRFAWLFRHRRPSSGQQQPESRFVGPAAS
jgi:hypothetical protein